MNASPSIPAPQAGAPLRTAIPGYLGDPARPRFAWLHRPQAPATVGMVIVPPFGFESICSNRTMRHLAESAAIAGIAAVRIDLDGTGDSAGGDHDADRWNCWLSSIDDACALLHAQGVQRVVLLGVRLGAALATQAAKRRGDIDGLVTLAAVTSGKAWLRETRALQVALDLSPSPAIPPSPAVMPPMATSQEIVGFALTEETRSSIATIDLLASDASPAPDVLIIDRDDFPLQEAMKDCFSKLGARVQHRQLPGYAEMMLDPHRAEIPWRMIEASIAFACQIGAVPSTVSGSSFAPGEMILARQARIATHAGMVVEEAIDLSSTLFGIATRPPQGQARRAVILLNAGAVGRIGPNRMHVELARRLAAGGDLALRLDLSGIGDSATQADSVENTVYSAHAVDDVGVAVQWARRQGVVEVVVAGLCSGAYHAYKAATSGQPINGIALINPLTFDYTPGMPLDFASFRVTAEARRYSSSMRSASSWKKVLNGQVNIGRVANIVARRVHGLARHRIRNLMEHAGLRKPEGLGAELAVLAQRGIVMHFIFSAYDPGHAILMEEGGVAAQELIERGALTVNVVEGADHTFTPLWSQPILIDTLLQAISGLIGA